MTPERKQKKKERRRHKQKETDSNGNGWSKENVRPAKTGIKSCVHAVCDTALVPMRLQGEGDVENGR
jgi:hypothetical protein